VLVSHYAELELINGRLYREFLMNIISIIMSHKNFY